MKILGISCGEVENYGSLDYVCAWYIKTAQFIQNTKTKVAFVSTNSVTQGEQVGTLWQYLLNKGITIHFAHRTFKWLNEARGKAQVYCVIIGFGVFEPDAQYLYDYLSPTSEPMEIKVKNISPYLIEADNTVILSRNKPICNAPEMLKGSQPTDDGNLLLTSIEKIGLLAREPETKKFIRPFISASEFLNGQERWCLWLQNALPNEIRALPEVSQRVKNVRTFRLASKKAATVRLADVPYLFAEIRQPDSDYVLIPRHSSENRKYIPMAFFSKENIAGDSCITLPQATLYHFGVLMSAMHMAWTRQVCGRIKGDYRYSNNIVYNNYPWPLESAPAQRQRVEQAAQTVLDARAQFPGATLADLYDPLAMPKSLVNAHKKLDAAVDACYRSKSFKSELERLEFLFDLYRQYTEPLLQVVKPAKKLKKSNRPVRFPKPDRS
jgi:hypothetical protein